MSTSPLAENYFTQELIIESLSMSVPDDIQIYVKDHPRLSFNRTIDFYKRIISMSNVRLLSTNINSYKLIDNSINWLIACQKNSSDRGICTSYDLLKNKSRRNELLGVRPGVSLPQWCQRFCCSSSWAAEFS